MPDLASTAAYYRRQADACTRTIEQLRRDRPVYADREIAAHEGTRARWLVLADEIDAYLARDPDVVSQATDPADDHDPLF